MEMDTNRGAGEKKGCTPQCPFPHQQYRPPLYRPLSFEGSSFHSSPLLHDIDGDGSVDLGVADTNGNLFWINTAGDIGDQYLQDYHIQIPKLKIRRDWNKDIDPNFRLLCCI